MALRSIVALVMLIIFGYMIISKNVKFQERTMSAIAVLVCLSYIIRGHQGDNFEVVGGLTLSYPVVVNTYLKGLWLTCYHLWWAL